MNDARPTHRCDRCRTLVADPRGHYFVELYGPAGFYCHPCFQTLTVPGPDG